MRAAIVMAAASAAVVTLCACGTSGPTLRSELEHGWQRASESDRSQLCRLAPIAVAAATLDDMRQILAHVTVTQLTDGIATMQAEHC